MSKRAKCIKLFVSYFFHHTVFSKNRFFCHINLTMLFVTFILRYVITRMFF